MPELLEITEDDWEGLVGEVVECFDRKKALRVIMKYIEDGADADTALEDITEEFGDVVEEVLGHYFEE